MILTWICTFCGWANDNNNGPCRRCGGQTEMKMVKGRWKEVTIKEPNREPTRSEPPEAVTTWVCGWAGKRCLRMGCTKQHPCSDYTPSPRVPKDGAV